MCSPHFKLLHASSFLTLRNVSQGLFIGSLPSETSGENKIGGDSPELGLSPPILFSPFLPLHPFQPSTLRSSRMNILCLPPVLLFRACCLYCLCRVCHFCRIDCNRNPAFLFFIAYLCLSVFFSHTCYAQSIARSLHIYFPSASIISLSFIIFSTIFYSPINTVKISSAITHFKNFCQVIQNQYNSPSRSRLRSTRLRPIPIHHMPRLSFHFTNWTGARHLFSNTALLT